ncbi:PIN domain-containing protein [Streptomyces chitinivorans]|uniref:PIN domain-containing protein n=1 Tax=Streptomyces chitinivorans TaxID=1257027 RepID=A0ABW7HLN8_9ACTN|nr:MULTISPECIES: PIN domain-containing protein [Streptomyces]MDH2409023.1 PIN domain-containing protein [Streptomyces chitinivorans]
MLITPRPGADRDTIRQHLRGVQLNAQNLRGSGYNSAYDRLLRYLEWATDSADRLRHQISNRDIEHLVLTRRYQALLSSCGTLAGSAQQRLVNGLVDLELSERDRALEEAVTDLERVISRWDKREVFVIADTSFYIHAPSRLDTLDLVAVLGIFPSDSIRLLFPMAVVDELDALKESSKQQARWRASYTLGLLDKTLQGGTSAVCWRQARYTSEKARGAITFEIVLDPTGHTRLPITDDEIIDRAVAIQSLARDDVRFLTCDTGQHTRGHAARLTVTKIPTKDPGPEPDWAAAQQPGTRAKRRARQDARNQSESEAVAEAAGS